MENNNNNFKDIQGEITNIVQQKNFGFVKTTKNHDVYFKIGSNQEF